MALLVSHMSLICKFWYGCVTESHVSYLQISVSVFCYGCVSKSRLSFENFGISVLLESHVSYMHPVSDEYVLVFCSLFFINMGYATYINATSVCGRTPKTGSVHVT
jgi:hypothetical protein